MEIMRVLACLKAAALLFALAHGVWSCGSGFEGGDGGSSSTSGGTGGVAGTGGSGATGGTPTATAGGGGTGGDECRSLGDACTACELTACPDQYCTCLFDNDACKQLLGCLLLCPVGYNPCVQGCYTEHAAGISDAALVQHCAVTMCADHCMALEPLPDCNVCLFRRCPEQMNACLADPDCATLLYCAKDCGDQVCVNECLAAYVGPPGLVEDVQTCLAVECSTECFWVLA